MCLLKKLNYKVNVTVGRTSEIMFPVKAVLDTGAGPNIISLRRLPAAWQSLIKPVKDPGLVTASRQSLPVHGTILLTLRIGQLQMRVAFLVVSRLAADMILGTTFIDRHVRAILPSARKIALKGAPSVPIIGETKKKGTPPPTAAEPQVDRPNTTRTPASTVSRKIRLARRVTVPPMSQTQVEVQSDIGGLSFLQNHPKMVHKHLALMANGVMELYPKRSFRVLLSNFSDQPANLPKNMVVGLALPAPTAILEVDSDHGV